MKLNNEQNTADNGEYCITVDNTEASVPSTSNINVSKDHLPVKEKPKLLLAIYDGPQIIDKIIFAREASKWKQKLNSCYANYQGSKLSCQDTHLPDNLPNIVMKRKSPLIML